MAEPEGNSIHRKPQTILAHQLKLDSNPKPYALLRHSNTMYEHAQPMRALTHPFRNAQIN